MTVFSVYNVNRCIGSCTAKCYCATQPKCACLCGGKNHGVGLKKALANTRELTVEEIRRNCPGEDGHLHLQKNQRQLRLFGDA